MSFQKLDLPAQNRIFLAALICGALGSSACTTHRVDIVTSHEDTMYLTTTKRTTYPGMSWVLSDDVEQSITRCAESKTKEGQPRLKCKSVDVRIDGEDWEQ